MTRIRLPGGGEIGLYQPKPSIASGARRPLKTPLGGLASDDLDLQQVGLAGRPTGTPATTTTLSP